MINCLCVELPDDKRIKNIIEILEQYNVDYLKFYFKTLFPPHNFSQHKNKIILFGPRQLVIDKILEYIKSEYGKEDCIYQSSFQLTDSETNLLINLSLK